MSGLTSGSSDLLADPESFLRELSRPSVTLDTLKQLRSRVQGDADEVNVALKKNVYKNYALFIDSAKMISLLKNEMFTLSTLLSNQQAVMSALTEIAICGDRTHGLTLNEKKEVAAKVRMTNSMVDSAYSSKSSDSSSTPTRNPGMSRSATGLTVSPSAQEQMTHVIDRIEGCASFVDTRNRYLLNQGELTELDADDYKKVPNPGKTLIVLLNDCLILAQAFPFPSRMGKKYKFQAVFELDNIAVVNVKDAGFRSAFKILMFPQTKVFDAESAEGKKKWLDSFDSAKKNRRSSHALQRRDSILFKSGDSDLAQQQRAMRKSMMSPVEQSVDRAVYSFDEELEDVSESEAEVIPVWLQDFPDDLDVLIAQRNFEDAVRLVLKVNSHLLLFPANYDNSAFNDLRLQVDHKIQELIDCISNELRASSDRSLQHGPRAARRAVHLLLKLGKSPLATKLYLDQRSSVLKFAIKQRLLSEGSFVPFIERLCRTFTNNLIETSRDFEKAFWTNISLLTPANDEQEASLRLEESDGIQYPVSYPASYPTACLVVWCQKQVTEFIALFSRNVFLPNVPLANVCESVSTLRNEINRFRNMTGIDLLFLADKLIEKDLRYSLLPHLYTLFYRNSLTAAPVIRSLGVNSPQDTKTSEIETQFMWGDGILINPVLFPGHSNIDAYFPAGRWYDFDTKQPITSGDGKIVKFSKAVSEIKVCIRGGSVYPTVPSNSITTTGGQRNQPFTLIAALDEEGKASGELYWDDGKPLDASARQVFTLIKFEATAGHFESHCPVNCADTTAMLAKYLHVLGVEDKVSIVKHIDTKGQKTSLTFDSNGSHLTIHLPPESDLRQNFTIDWSYISERM